MTSGQTPDELADEMAREATQYARAHLALFEAAEGTTIAENDRLIFEVGVQAGYVGTLEMLVNRGLLPSTPEAQ